MIPKTIHRVWVGKADIPDDFQRYWKEWEELHPDWSLRTWRDEDLAWLKNRKVYDACNTHSERSDVARFEILAKHGGIYVDTDVEPLRPLDGLLRLGAFAGWEKKGRLCGAVMGTEPKHRAARALVDQLPIWVRRHNTRSAEVRTGPIFLSHVWVGREDVSVLHREAFYPVGWWEMQKLGKAYPETSYAVHHWAHSWKKAKE